MFNTYKAAKHFAVTIIDTGGPRSYASKYSNLAVNETKGINLDFSSGHHFTESKRHKHFRQRYHVKVDCHSFLHRVVSIAALSVAATACSASSAGSMSLTPLASVRVKCEDRISDAAMLQHAIDSSPVGAAIEFQGGTCLLTTGLRLLGDRTYTGENTTGTVLRQDSSTSYILASSAYVDGSTTTGDPLSILDLTVSCNGSGHTDGIVLLNWQADVENVDVGNCGGSGIVDTNTNASGGAIVNTSVNSRFENDFVENSGQYGFEVNDSGNSVTDGFLIDNQIASSKLDAVHLDNAAGWDISGNHLYGIGGNGISASRLFGSTISSNYIEDFGDGKTSGAWYGIFGSVQSGSGSTILGNKIFNYGVGSGNARYVYLGITQTNNGTGYLSVTGNVIVGNGYGIGMLVNGGSNKLDVARCGNQVGEVESVLIHLGNVVFTGC
jgi:hypothetical protein